MIDELWKAPSFSQLVHDVFVEEGEMKAARELAQRALEWRFGTLSETIQAALNEVDKASLEDVILHTDWSMEQVRERLGLAWPAQPLACVSPFRVPHNTRRGTPPLPPGRTALRPHPWRQDGFVRRS